MGELYGSEYWTYLLPKRVGQATALELSRDCQPLGAQKAREIGFLDDVFGEDVESFEKEVRRRAVELAQAPDYAARIVEKLQRRLDDEFAKPLANYRAEELERMRVNFFGPDPAYHEARRRFVFKGSPPTSLAIGPAASAGARQANACHQVETQSAWPFEEDRRSRGSLSMTQAWVHLLQVTIRRIFATAP
jgi:putative two-component system hydrogenase maturation factor HypX/HoxX